MEIGSIQGNCAGLAGYTGGFQRKIVTCAHIFVTMFQLRLVGVPSRRAKGYVIFSPALDFDWVRGTEPKWAA